MCITFGLINNWNCSLWEKNNHKCLSLSYFFYNLCLVMIDFYYQLIHIIFQSYSYFSIINCIPTHMQCMFGWILTSAMYFFVDHLPDFMNIDYCLFNLKKKGFLPLCACCTPFILPITLANIVMRMF